MGYRWHLYICGFYVNRKRWDNKNKADTNDGKLYQLIMRGLKLNKLPWPIISILPFLAIHKERRPRRHECTERLFSPLCSNRRIFPSPTKENRDGFYLCKAHCTLAIFHDGEYKETDVDVEVQKSVRGSYTNTEHVVFKTEPPVLIASATYKGGYDKIDGVSEAIANWVRDNDYDFNGLSFNIDHVSPHETQNPDEWVTEVCYPVKRK